MEAQMPGKKSLRYPPFFPPTGDPIDNIVAAGLNIDAYHGLNRFSREVARVLGVSGDSTQDQINLNRSKLALEKQQAVTAKVKVLSEMEVQMYNLKLQEKELAIQEKKRLLDSAEAERAQLALPEAEMVVDGALAIPQERGGIVLPDGSEPEGYQDWLDSLGYGKVTVILGRRGAGKTSLGARIAEFVSATHGMSIYWVGLPEQARNLLPHWVKLVNTPDQYPANSVILADEAGLRYASLAFNTRENQLLRSLLMVTRHRSSSLIFCTQSSRDVEYSIIRQADCIAFKQPGLHQPDSERPDLRSMARKAAEVFQKIPKERRPASALIFDDLFSGLITTTLPSFWSDELSHVYQHVDLGQIEGQAKRAKELDQVVKEETKLLSADSLDADILRLRQEGNGIEKIAKILDCSVHRVRKCLNI
jgi:energy-coupling factor transporter ATP-binding protein EcfA2